ncbi:hypothetical protein AOT81_11995 [Xylella fastidiosa]|nr:hypothetical protein AOT81_11995 [Xylella fastidiosa]
MGAATLENAPTPGGSRFTKIYNKYGHHIITRDAHMGLEWTAHAFEGYDGAGYSNLSKNTGAEWACRVSDIGGHTDWRLPKLNEALSIGLVDTYWPSNYEGWLWTCTPCEKEPKTKAWAVKFGTTDIRIEERCECFHVRAVRGQMRTDATATPKAGES